MGTEVRLGMGTRSTVHIAARGRCSEWEKPIAWYRLVPVPVVKWVWNPSVPNPISCPVPVQCVVCT